MAAKGEGSAVGAPARLVGRVKAGRRGGRKAGVRWSARLGARIVARVAAGELLYVVLRERGMPTPQTLARWAREHEDFGAALAEARTAGGRLARGGGVWSYCEDVAEAVFERLCAGEGLTAIARDPAMPSLSTLYHWRRRFRAFDEMVQLAMRVQADRCCDEGLELAMAATPETAYLTHVRLTHMRWMAGVKAPRSYRFKPVEGEAGREPVRVLMRRFEIETDPETGEQAVVAYCPNPDTGQVEREDAAGWRPPPGVRIPAGGWDQ